MSYKIYMLDTDLQHADMIKQHLSKYDEYQISVFTSVKDCLEKIKQAPPALIFMDAEIKHDDATMKKDIEIIKEFKKLSPHSEVVLFSGTEHIEVMQDTIHHGAFDLIVKSHVSHLRAENEILQAMRHFKMVKQAKFYKALTWTLAITMIGILVFAVVGYKTGLIHDWVASPFTD